MEGWFFDIVVEGEVSGFRLLSVGYYYFNFVDYYVLLSVVVFKNCYYLLLFVFCDGEWVWVCGGILIY